MKTNTTQKRHQIQVQTYSKEITFLYKDARVHYVVLKQQPHHTHPHHSTNQTPPTKMENTQSTPRSSSVMPRNTKDQPTHTSPPPPHTVQKKKQDKKGPLLLQDPTVCQTPHHHTTNNPKRFVPTHPQRGAVLKPGRQLSIIDYFIDIPPLSSPPGNKRSRYELFS